MEAVEEHRHQHAATAVNGRERAEQQAGAILVAAEYDEVEDGLDNEAQDAAHHENPEQVVEVQGDVALAGRVQPQRACLGGLAVFLVAQVAMQPALLGKGGVQVGLQRHHQHQ